MVGRDRPGKNLCKNLTTSDLYSGATRCVVISWIPILRKGVLTIKREEESPDVDRPIASTIFSFFKMDDVQRRVIGVNDLLNIELVNDKLKQFDDAWEETLMALEEEPEEDLLEGFYSRQLEKSIVMQNALELCKSPKMVQGPGKSGRRIEVRHRLHVHV